MPVTSRWLDEPPLPAPRPVSLIAIVIFLVIVGLGIYAVVAGGLTTPAPASEVVTPAPAATEPALQLVTPAPTAPEAPALAATVEPTATATATATPAPPTAGCPLAAPVPDGARLGWLARARGCPDVLYARVNGKGQWVLKPFDFPEDLFSQLPEL